MNRWPISARCTTSNVDAGNEPADHPRHVIAFDNKPMTPISSPKQLEHRAPGVAESTRFGLDNRATEVTNHSLNNYALRVGNHGRFIGTQMLALLAVITIGSAATLSAQTTAPSRKADKGCTWEKVADASSGLTASVERCDYGNRKIHMFMKGNALVQQYSDGGGAADTLIDVVDLRAGETMEAGMQRAFSAHAKAAIAKRCVLAPYKEGKELSGAKRYEFVPDATFKKELAKKNIKGDLPDPPCGDWGTAPDGIQYFQVFPANTVRKFLFVRIGQDTPLFDERTLQLNAPQTTPTKHP